MSIFSRVAAPFLPDRDYLPVAMPTTDVHALQVLARDGGVLRRYSTLANTLRNVPGAVLPPITSDERVVDARGTTTRSTKIGLGLSVVTEILNVLGGGAGVNLTADRAHSVQFSYADVSADRVDLVDLERWLSTADFDPSARTTAGLLAAADLYVVTAVLKARALSVSLLDEHNNGIDLDVPALQAVATANLTIRSAGSRASTVTFHGDTELAVAAKATRIQLDEVGFHLDRRPRTAGEIRGGLAGPGLQPELLAGEELRLASV